MSHTHLFLILLSSTLFLSLYPANCQSPTQCDTTNRPLFCTEIGPSVCGFPQGCLDGIACGQPFDSGCLACSDATIAYYTQGPCEPDLAAEEAIIAPVAPIFGTTVCSTTAPAAVVNGKNVTGTSCCGSRNDVCLTSSPVCGYYSNCQGDSCSVTKSSRCEACYDANIDFYIPGVCPPSAVILEEEILLEEWYDLQEVILEEASLEENVIRVVPVFCNTNVTPLCGQSPVCAYLKGCLVGNCSYTADSNCAACNDPNVSYYVNGECLAMS